MPAANGLAPSSMGGKARSTMSLPQGNCEFPAASRTSPGTMISAGAPGGSTWEPHYRSWPHRYLQVKAELSRLAIELTHDG